MPAFDNLRSTAMIHGEMLCHSPMEFKHKTMSDIFDVVICEEVKYEDFEEIEIIIVQHSGEEENNENLAVKKLPSMWLIMLILILSVIS